MMDSKKTIRYLGRLASVVMVMTIFLKSEAQQQVHFTQYMFNGLILNPAYAGADGALSLTALNRSQWLGVDGAPTTQTLSAHTLFNNEHVGVGLSIINDKIGVHKNLSALSYWAYHLKVAKNAYLSMGIQGGVNNKKSDYASLTSNGANDPRQFQNVSNTFMTLGAGFYFRSPKLEIGISAPEIIPGRITVRDTIHLDLNKVHYFLFSKYKYKLSGNVTVEPSLLLKYLPGVPLSFDLNVNFVINQVLTTGLSYRKNESVDLLLKLKLTPQLMMGYAYDVPVGSISAMSNGSHEIMLNYIFKFTDNVVSPR